MTIRECYEEIHSDMDAVLGRFGTESLVKRFALKFPKDPSFANLQQAIREQNAEEAFRAAHTLKGVAANLGFEPLHAASSELTELLRGKQVLAGSEAACAAVKEAYEKTIAALDKLEP